jgi:hypothetical protein
VKSYELRVKSGGGAFCRGVCNTPLRDANESYESNGYVWYTWYEGSGSDRHRGNDLRYFPQAGTHLMLHLAARF